MPVWSAFSLGRQVTGIATKSDSDRFLEIFAQYLSEEVRPQAVVEAWEWQVDVLADLNYHHPLDAVVDALTAMDRYNEESTIAYDPATYEPEYLLDGPWSKTWDLYEPFLAGACCILEQRVPPYDLYRVDAEREGE